MIGYLLVFENEAYVGRAEVTHVGFVTRTGWAKNGATLIFLNSSVKN